MGGLFTVHPPMGLLYISSVLLKNKHDVSIIDADIDDFSLDDIRDKITLERPQIVGITMNTFQTKSAFETAYTIKSTDPNITVVVGGPHPTIIGKQILDDCESIDIAVIGEGEHTMLEVANTIENSGSLNDVCGICYRDENEIKTTSPRDFITDLDTLPLPSVELVQPIDRYPGPHPTGAKPTVQIMASRGCPFKCTFCSNPVWGNTVRFRSPENILTEIESLHEKYGVKEIFFQDDTFNLNREWFEKICHGIIDKGLNDKMLFKTPFRVNKNLIDSELLNLAKKAGFWMIFYGVESGNQDILNITQKGTTLDEIERAFKLTKKAQIKTYASFMMGNINETPETIKDTIDFAKKIDPDYYGFAIATPFPGSEFYVTAKERGYLQVNDFTKYDLSKYILKTEYLCENDLKAFIQLAPLTIKKHKLSIKYKIKRFVELLPLVGPNRALWELRNHGIENSDYLPIYKDDVEPSFLDDHVEMGINDSSCLGKGWYHVESVPQTIRWTKKKADIYLKAEANSNKVFIKAFTQAPSIKGWIYINGKRTEKFSIQNEEWKLLEATLQNIRKPQIIEITIKLNNTWIPNKLIQNGDTRELGIAIHKIWLE